MIAVLAPPSNLKELQITTKHYEGIFYDHKNHNYNSFHDLLFNFHGWYVKVSKIIYVTPRLLLNVNRNIMSVILPLFCFNLSAIKGRFKIDLNLHNLFLYVNSPYQAPRNLYINL